jgi:hypothetical protein
MGKPRVFISMGTPYTDDYHAFRGELEAFLRNECEVDPRIIGVNEYPSGSPLGKIRDVMRTCNGVIIVAYERKHVGTGTEKRGSSAAKAFEDRAYTTPWNHIESAMAFSMGVPIHILCQKGLAEEGLIETKVDWYVQYLDVKAGAFRSPEVSAAIRAWIKDQVSRHARRPNLLGVLSGQVRFSDMTPNDVVGATAVIVTSFAAGAALATFVPQLFGG